MKNESSNDELQSLFRRNQPKRTSVDVASIIAQRRKYHSIRKVVAMTIRASALVAIAGSLAYVLFGPLLGTQSVAFAEAKLQVEKVRSVEYVEISYSGEETRANSSEPTVSDALPRLEKALTTVHEDLKEDIRFQNGIFTKLSKQSPRVLGVRRVRIKGKHLERTDQLFPHAWETQTDYVAPPYTIRNARNGLSVGFTPQEKKRTVLKKQVVIEKDGEQSETDIEKIPPTVDFFARFRSIPDKATQKLGEKTIAEQKVVGFRSVETHRSGVWTRTYWISSKSKLPVEIVTELHKDDTLKQRWVKNHFEFDREIPDEVFSTDTPEGYKSEDGKVFGLAL